MPKQLEDQVGKRYNRLTVTEFAGKKGKQKRPHWNCACDCGNVTCVSQSDLRNNHTKSCGCYDLDRKKTHKPISERFWPKVNIPEDKTKCWEWNAGLDSMGYGAMSMPGKKYFERSHRISWTLKNGDIPKELCVLHRCDNPKCVNPDHLFLGTNSDNVSDKVKKKRHAFGARQGIAKQTEASAKNIIALYHAGMDRHILSRIFGTRPANIRNIVSGERWSHLTRLTMLKKLGPLLRTF